LKRVYVLYLKDILEAIERIESYVRGFTFEQFAKSTLVIDAVVRNFEIIGEATKHIPVEVKLGVSFDQMERYGRNAG